jgi:hypothetical protein
MRHPRLYEMLGMAAASAAPPGENGGWLRNVPAVMQAPPVRAWLSQRDLPPAPARSFRQMWRLR